jgi:hypothetical protein
MSPPEVRRGRSGQEAPSIKIAHPSQVPADPLDELARHVDGSFVLVVHTTGGKYRRRCFLSVTAAERAARNAVADGHIDQIYLAELKPLWRLTSGGP